MTWTASWNGPIPASTVGECRYSQEIIAMISYDPDIAMDGNVQNDDVRSSNNMKKRTVNYIVQCPL